MRSIAACLLVALALLQASPARADDGGADASMGGATGAGGATASTSSGTGGATASTSSGTGGAGGMPAVEPSTTPDFTSCDLSRRGGSPASAAALIGLAAAVAATRRRRR